MEDTQRILSLWPETKTLLDLASAQNVPIVFNGDLIGTDTDGVNIINRTAGTRQIELKPYKSPEDCAIALIHELRHLWQDVALGLTAATRGLGERDATTVVLLNRVREADAYAFTDLMIGRINHFQEDFRKSENLRAALLFLHRGQPLTEGQENEVSDVIAEAITGRLPAERAAASAKFEKALSWLDSYDCEAIQSYQRRYCPPIDPGLPHMTEAQGHIVTLADIRKLCVVGEGPTRISYMDDLADQDFTALVMKDVKPSVAEVISMIEDFENAGAKNVKQKAEIDTRLRAALKP
jgi:hypothetical protein